MVMDDDDRFALGFQLFEVVADCLSVTLPPQFAFKASLPTGPMILLSAFAVAILLLFLSPEKGLISRAFRLARFRFRCKEENIVKALWREEKRQEMNGFHLLCLKMKGLAYKENGTIHLTKKGRERALHIVRLHRLWEAYLVFLGQGAEKVHKSAEEMEHILTPELEEALSSLLQNPSHDPHKQPIPQPQKGER